MHHIFNNEFYRQLSGTASSLKRISPFDGSIFSVSDLSVYQLENFPDGLRLLMLFLR